MIINQDIKLPFGIIIIAIWEIAVGVLIFIFSIANLFSPNGLTLSVISGLLGILCFIISYGLIKGMPWAKTILTIITFIGLFTVIGTLPSIAILWYLNKPSVKIYFGELIRAYEKNAPPPPPPIQPFSLEHRVCPTCNSSLTYEAVAQRYWCPKCMKYTSGSNLPPLPTPSPTIGSSPQISGKSENKDIKSKSSYDAIEHELSEWKSLLDSGVISQAEYESEKKRLLEKF